jgi:hypothetical protein
MNSKEDGINISNSNITGDITMKTITIKIINNLMFGIIGRN